MQWFTEFMELFLSVWKLIKTLIFILSASLRIAPRACWRRRREKSSGRGPQPQDHRVSSRSPGSPRRGSAIPAVGVWGTQCSELGVSAKTPGSGSQDPTGRRKALVGLTPLPPTADLQASRRGRRGGSARLAVSLSPATGPYVPRPGGGEEWSVHWWEAVLGWGAVSVPPGSSPVSQTAGPWWLLPDAPIHVVLMSSDNQHLQKLP